MADRAIDPHDVRERVRQVLAELPADQHLDALKAIDHGDVDLDLSDPDVVRVVLGERMTIEVPVSQWDEATG